MRVRWVSWLIAALLGLAPAVSGSGSAAAREMGTDAAKTRHPAPPVHDPPRGAWPRRGGQRVDLPPEVLARRRARFARFKGGGRIWGHGIGRKIALTFDDGPNYQTTPRLLDHLDAFGVKATFFVNSQRFNPHGLITGKSYAVLLEEARRGYLVGNHTYSHPLLPSIPPARQRRQIEHTDRAIEAALGVPSYLFRPPYGALSAYAKRLLRNRGTTVVMWNIGSDDDQHFNVAKVVAGIMQKLEILGGGIILMHDTHYWSVEAVVPLLRALRVQSCRFLALGEEPYEVVGLEYFLHSPRRHPVPRSDQDRRAWLRRRAALAASCQRPPRGALPAFLRGEVE